MRRVSWVVEAADADSPWCGGLQVAARRGGGRGMLRCRDSGKDASASANTRFYLMPLSFRIHLGKFFSKHIFGSNFLGKSGFWPKHSHKKSCFLVAVFTLVRSKQRPRFSQQEVVLSASFCLFQYKFVAINDILLVLKLRVVNKESRDRGKKVNEIWTQGNLDRNDCAFPEQVAVVHGWRAFSLNGSIDPRKSLGLTPQTVGSAAFVTSLPNVRMIQSGKISAFRGKSMKAFNPIQTHLFQWVSTAKATSKASRFAWLR